MEDSDVDWLTGALDKFTYFGIALTLFLAGLGVPIPEDIPLIFGGVMAGAGKINVVIHFFISMVFIVVGDTCLYFIGRKVGNNAGTKKGFAAKLLTPARREKASGYFDKYGNWTVFFGRFVAGVRGGIFLTAGAVNFPLGRFLLMDSLAALISVPVWIYLGYTFGENWHEILETAKHTQGWVLGGIALVAGGALFYFKFWRKRGKQAPEAPAVEAIDVPDPAAISADSES